MPMGGPLIMPRSRVTPRRCANLYLRYLLHNLIQLALTLLFTFKTKRMTVSCFVFGVQYVCHLTGESETRCKTFWCLWKTCGRAGATSGLAFDYSLKGHFSGYQSFRHTVISPHDFSQNITVISSHLNHNKAGLTVSLCRRRTISRPKR